MELQVRAARAEDARSLSEFAAKLFRDTFAAQNEAANLEGYLAESFNTARQAAEIDDPLGVVLLAELAEGSSARRLVGYAHLVASQTPQSVTGPAPLELKRLYVEPRWHGHGIARALLDAAMAAARSRGAETLWLGVWERNPRAIAFYTKCGFARVGEHTFVLGSDHQTDWIYALPLADPA